MCDVSDQMKKSIELTIEELEKIEAEKDNGKITDGQYYYMCQAMKDHYERYQKDPELDKLDKNIKNINFLMYVICNRDTASAEEFETAINIITEMKDFNYWSNYFSFTYRISYHNDEFKDIILNISKKIYVDNTCKLMCVLHNWEKSNYYYGYHRN